MSRLPRIPLHRLDSGAGFAFDYTSAPKDLVRLDCNEYFTGPDEEERAAFSHALEQAVFHRYPDMRGRPLREAYARYLGVNPDEILVAHGSVETIGILIEAFCTRSYRESEAGATQPSKVLFPEPTFPLFRVIASHHGVDAVGIPLQSDFALDEDAMLQALRQERPAVVFVPSPNNPTGNHFDPQVLRRLIAAAPEAFVVDEAYAEFDGRSMVRTACSTPGLFVMRSLSKVGFAGLRLGAVVGHRDSIAELDRVRVPWNVDAFAMGVGCEVLARPDKLRARVDAVVRSREQLAAALRAIPDVMVYPSAANFLLVRLPTDATRVAHALLERGVLVRDVSAPGLLAGCLRITVGSPGDNERCVLELRRVLARA